MLKTLIQLFSKDHPFEKKINNPHIASPLIDDKMAKTAEELKNAGDQSLKTNELDQAELYYRKSLEANPTQSGYRQLGIVLYHLKRLDEAIANFDHAIALNPAYAEAYNSRGVSLYYQNKLNDALISYDRAITLKPDYAEAYSNRGLTLNDLKQLDEAIKSLDRAIALKPDFFFAYNNRGIVLKGLNKFDEAIKSLDRAIALKPDYAEAYNNMGNVLKDLNRLNDALISYDRAIALKPNYAEAYNNRAIVLGDFKRFDEALTSYSYALSLNPDHDFLYGNWINIKITLCDWNNYDNHIKQLADKIEYGKNVSPPLLVLAISSSRGLQKKAAEIFVQARFPIQNTLAPISKYSNHDKIRIGYFSADFRNHAVSFLIAELFEKHDRSKFELIAFSFGLNTEDQMRRRAIEAFDQFIDVSQFSDQEVASMARKLEIDIAIDLGGFTTDCRTGIFAFRAAPLQISYLGYPGTMGAEYIDYLIADKTIIPEAHQKDYSEKIAYLPSFQVNDSKRKIANKIFTREELGLPSRGFVFCCFNNSYKITPCIFESWMRILQHVEGSVLWLFEDSATVVSNLIKEATLRGIDGKRLIFAKRLPLPEYLARYRTADLFLDTLPYNAGTTASDALWAGLPVLTRLGDTFAGRMAASLLNAIHLPELITYTQEEYEALAITLATHPNKLLNIKQRLAKNRLTTPLFDIQQFTQHIEAAYTKMHERYQANLMPDHLNITS